MFGGIVSVPAASSYPTTFHVEEDFGNVPKSIAATVRTANPETASVGVAAPNASGFDIKLWLSSSALTEVFWIAIV